LGPLPTCRPPLSRSQTPSRRGSRSYPRS
jgi:hypothetical protein